MNSGTSTAYPLIVKYAFTMSLSVAIDMVQQQRILSLDAERQRQLGTRQTLKTGKEQHKMYRVEKIKSRDWYHTVTATFTNEDGEKIERTWEVGDGITDKDLVNEYCEKHGRRASYLADCEQFIVLSDRTILDWLEVLHERAQEEAEDTADELDDEA